MNLYVINSLFFGFSVFLLSILILLKRNDEMGRRWFYFSIFVTVWAVFYAFQINNDVSNEFALAAARTNNVASAFIPATWLYFICGFLHIERRKIFWCSWLVALVLMLISPTNLFIPSVSPAKGFIHYMDPGPIYHLHTINFFVIVSYGFYLMIYAYFKEQSKENRQEIFSLFLATVFGFVGGSTAYALVYLRNGAIDLTFLLSTYPFIMTYVMIKHRVLDIEKLADAFQREKLAAVGVLAASMNHELRNPLYVAKGTLESYLENVKEGLYQNGEESESARKAALTSLMQMNRAMEIMQRFMSFAKPSLEKTEEESVKFQELFARVLELVGFQFNLQKIRVMQVVEEDLEIFGNRGQLEEIFVNLIINACQAMQEGGELRIEAREKVLSSLASYFSTPASRNGRSIEITISDTGPGIPPDRLSKIFQPFYTTKESGTGLGLYVTKQLVERNQGRIRVRSKVGEGTSFNLEFSGIKYRQPNMSES